MGEIMKIGDSDVISSLDSVCKKLKDIEKASDKLKQAIEAYKDNFQDEISEKSSSIVQTIDEEIKVVSDKLNKQMINLKAPMESLGKWRSEY